MSRARLAATLLYLALAAVACDLDGQQGSNEPRPSTGCLSTCRQAASAGCLADGYDCTAACTQQARLGCDDASEAIYTCTLEGSCSDADRRCSSEIAANTACRDAAAPEGCVADCLDVESRGCALTGFATCQALCSNGVAAGCEVETAEALTCLIEALDAGDDCFGGDPPAACAEALDAIDATCETLQN